MSVDTKWFKLKIEESGHSLRTLAPKLKNKLGKPMDIHALSKLINGQRDMSVSDAVHLAEVFGCDVREVIKRAGFKI